MPVLREALLSVSRSEKLKQRGVRRPAGARDGRPVRRRRAHRGRRPRHRRARRVRPPRHHRPPRRGHPRPRAGRGHARRLPRPARRPRRRRAHRAAPRCRSSSPRSARRCPATARRSRSTTRATICAKAAARRHHGDPRHGGPHHHRLHAGHPARAARRLPADRRACCRPTSAAPRPTAATSPTRARGCGCARAPTSEPESVAYQDRAEVDRAYVRCLKILMAGDGLPDARHARPAPGRDRRRARGPQRPRAGHATSSRCSTASAPTSSSGSRPRASGCASTCRTATSGTATSCAGWPSEPANLALLARALDLEGLSTMGLVAIFGAGVMGETLLSGLLRAGRPPPTSSSPSGAPSAPPSCARSTASRWSTTSRRPSSADTLVLVVKPQDMGALLRRDRRRTCARARSSSRSRPASRPSSSSRGCPRACPVVRVMPNTPALVDQGMAAISPGAHCDDEHLARGRGAAARRSARSCGCREKHQDAVTAISGSGPAYIFYVVEAMIEAGVLLGLPRSTATELVVQTLLRRGHDAARDRRAPERAARERHLARRHDRRRAARRSTTTRCGRRSSPRWRPRATAATSSPRDRDPQ